MATLGLGQLAFYWRMTDQPNVPPNVVPDFVDFEFSFLEEYQLIIQTRNADTWRYLEQIYRENFNVGYLQEGHALAAAYGGDFIRCIDEALSHHHPGTRRITEIGAGGGYVLKQLKAKGYEVAAIDPSPIAVAKGKELGIEVIPSFYPSDHAVPRSDCIIHYDVLEHVSNPSDFLRRHLADLNPGGLVIFVVPDCSPYIEYGDLSMILHEHLNYYDDDSLRHVVESAGLEVLEIRKGGYGGTLCCIARAAEAGASWKKQSGTGRFDEWVRRVERLRTLVSGFMAAGTASGNTLGCYVPLRALPYLALRGQTTDVRFFDDDPGIHHRYFDGFPVPVENMDDLKAKPVTHLLILSAAFGDKIRHRINERMPGHSMKIVCLSDLGIFREV